MNIVFIYLSLKFVTDACCDNSAIASDGSYLYIHTDTGLYKIGSGYSSTIKVGPDM